MSENGQRAVGLLDQLDALRAAATVDLPWRVGDHYGIHVYGGPDEQAPVGTCHQDTDAALIVAAVNAVPRLVAALRGVLGLADELEADASKQVDESDSLASVVGRSWVNAARQFRSTVAAALTDGTPR